MSTEDKFYDLSDDALSQIKEVVDRMALPFSIKIKYLGDSKLKKLIKLQKTNDITVFLTGVDLIVSLNEDYLIKLEQKNAEILITQELDRLQFDIQKGGFKIGKFPLQTTAGVLKKYGIEAVAEANELTELINKSEKDNQEIKPKKKKDISFLK